MPCHMSFAQINAALAEDKLQGLCLLNVLAAFVTDSKPGSRQGVVDTEALCRRVDGAIRLGMQETRQLKDVANALFLITMAASGDELKCLFKAMATSGSLERLIKLTGNESIAKISVAFERCVLSCVVLLFKCPLIEGTRIYVSLVTCSAID